MAISTAAKRITRKLPHHVTKNITKKVPTIWTLKRAYARSLKSIKNHPIQSSLGVMTLGAGLASGLYMLLKFKKH